MSAMATGGVKPLGVTVPAVVELSGIFRLTTITGRLRAMGPEGEAMAAKLEEMSRECSVCSLHGRLVDPIVGILPADGSIALMCPACSSPEVRERYEREGRREMAS
jgi:hypothetical protein